MWALRLAVLCCIALSPGAGRATPPQDVPPYDVPPELRVALATLSPGSEIVQAEDVDRNVCGPTRSPGLVMADFNGDGRGDFAVLLKIYANRTVENPTSKPSRLWFVVLLADAMGVPRPVSVQSLDLGLLNRTRLEPGALAERQATGDAKTAAPRRPVVIRRICKKSASLFYWHRMAVRKLDILDRRLQVRPRLRQRDRGRV